MHLRCFITLVFSSLVVMAMVLMVPSVVLGQDGPVPPTTPPGVTLVDVVRELPTSSEGLTAAYEAAAEKRVQEVNLLCGTLLPLWKALGQVLRPAGGRRDAAPAASAPAPTGTAPAPCTAAPCWCMYSNASSCM